MFRYGKLARQAVSAISYIAERHGPANQAISSAEVGKARGIPKALAAKLLSEAASAGLLHGTTGPGGGYRLAKAPDQIAIMEVVRLFERPLAESPCPFGPGWCGNGAPCPLHEGFVQLEGQIHAFLTDNTLAVFVGRPKE